MEKLISAMVDIDVLVETNQPFLQSNDSINAKVFNGRNLFIEQLSAMQAAASAIVTKLEEIITKAKSSHTEDIATITGLISGDDGWKQKLKKQSPTQPVYITPALSLQAIIVPTFSHVKQNGRLYFVDTANHFAFKLNGRLFHGNIGKIFSDERTPTKIKECKYKHCSKTPHCDYYHDPLKFPGSKDCRNYVAASWLYSPAANQRFRNRAFGSRDNLDVDIGFLASEDVNRYTDQVCHDLLCALLLNSSN